MKTVNSNCRVTGRCTNKRTRCLSTRQPSMFKAVPNDVYIWVDADLASATSSYDYSHAVFGETGLRLPCLVRDIPGGQQVPGMLHHLLGFAGCQSELRLLT